MENEKKSSAVRPPFSRCVTKPGARMNQDRPGNRSSGADSCDIISALLILEMSSKHEDEDEEDDCC